MRQIQYSAHMPLFELQFDDAILVCESIEDLLQHASSQDSFGLHVEEQGPYSRFRSKKRQNEYAASRYLAKQVLARFTDTAASHWYILRHDNGAAVPQHSKPQLHVPLFLSISHNSGYCAVAVSRRQIGIDLQAIETLERWKKIQATVFSKLEISGISELEQSDQALRFTELWALKEALGKLHGHGLKPKTNRNLSFVLQEHIDKHCAAVTFQANRFVLAISLDRLQNHRDPFKVSPSVDYPQKRWDICSSSEAGV